MLSFFRLVIEKMHQIHSFRYPPSLYAPDFDMGLFYIRRVITDWNKLIAEENMNNVMYVRLKKRT